MVASQSLRELISVLITDIPGAFPGIDCVTIACLDPEYELARLLEQGGQPQDFETSAFIPLTREALDALFPVPWTPRLGRGDERMRALLFPGLPRPAASMALAPLVLREKLIGCLNQASMDPLHFATDTATDLLEHLAAITALCVDNAVSHERLKLDGLTDPLTAVANRRFFERRMAEEVERWERHQEPLTCMLVDVDHFKHINDRYGHQIGDNALKRVAELLGQDLRGSDVLARYGGEEFVLLLPGTTEQHGLMIADRLRSRVAAGAFPGPERSPIHITVSIGLACLTAGPAPERAASGEWLFREADTALYAAKRTGRNRVVTRSETHA